MTGKQPHEPAFCGAKKKNNGICQAPAGRGTDHVGEGKCKHHGGASKGAPRGNKNALRTGQYESILLDALEDDERELYDQVDTGTLALVEEELRITTIRERRMLQRIAQLREVAGGLTLVEESHETIAGGEGGDIPDRILSKLDSDEVDELTAACGGGVTKTKQKRAGTLGQIQSIETALTAVQGHKAKLIDLKHKLETQGSLNPGDDADFDGSLWEGISDGDGS